MPAPESVVIRPLMAGDTLGSLSLGGAEHTPLKTYLKRHARIYEQKWLARTYVLVDAAHAEVAGRVWGYLALVASQIETTPQNRPSETHWPESYHLPAIKLARMAVDKELQGKHYGTRMLEWAIALVKSEVASHVGCHLLVTDAKKSAVGFYERAGFTMLDSPNNKASANPLMFIHLAKL